MCNENQKWSGGKSGALRRGTTASRGWSDRGSFEDDDDDFGSGGVVPFDAPDHNFSSCLTLDALVDGQFAARLDLERIPFGDITIRIRNYRLEVIVDRVGGPAGGTTEWKRPDDAHRVSRPFYCGAVDVPIYVDTTTIRLQSVDDGKTDTIYITARMKVCSHISKVAILSEMWRDVFKSLSTLSQKSATVLSQKSETVAVVSPFSATVALFCDSVDRA